MAIKKITRSINVEDVWVHVECQNCHNGYRVRMNGATKRKNCPLCNSGSFFFQLTPVPGGIQVDVEFTGKDNVRVLYPLKSEQIEIDE